VLVGGGGFVDEFYSFYAPLGDRFVLIDGSCNYTASLANELGEIRTGQLDARRAEALEASLSYSRLDGFEESYDRGCISEGYVTFLSAPWARVACPCGCSDGPRALQSAFRAGVDLVGELFDAGTPSTGALEILLVAEPAQSFGPPPLEWPALWDPAPRFYVPDAARPVEPDAGVAVEDPAERTALRALREQWRASTSSSVPRIDTYARMQDTASAEMTWFRLYLRDEAPPQVAAALAAVRERR
jgi:hypothetical protein